MSERLELIASLVNDGRGAADVGTDHGYVPLLLYKRGYPGNIIASDLRRGPLDSAVASAREEGAEDRISFVLCDGLSGVEPSKVDNIVVAGMGGDTITGILDRDYWCAAPGYRLILQPMSHQNVLRYWLINNEFCITEERLVREAGAVYQVFTAEYGKSTEYTDAELFTGSFGQICRAPLFGEYLDGLISKFSSAVAGMEAGKSAGSGRTGLYRGVLTGLEEMKARLLND